MRGLTTATEVLNALGGTESVRVLTRRKTYSVVANWKTKGEFPTDTYLLMKLELHTRGCNAPESLWGMATPQDGGQFTVNRVTA